MSGKLTLTKKKFAISEDVEDLLRRKVTPFGTGAKVGCPKEYLGKTVYIVACKE